MKTQDLNQVQTKTIIDRQEMVAAFEKFYKITDRKTCVPALSSTMITGANDHLIAKTTDCDIELTSRIPIVGASNIAAFPPTKGTLDFVKQSKETFLTLSQCPVTDKTSFELGQFTSSLKSAPMDTYVDMPATEGPNVTIVMEAKKLLKDLQRVEKAISTEETRYYLNGVCLSMNSQRYGGKDQLAFVATDGHRLAKQLPEVFYMSGSLSELDTQSIILPRKTVLVLIALLKRKDAPTGFVSFTVSNSRVTFYIGDDVLSSKLIDGTFPDYARVIPNPTSPIEIKFDRKEMLDAVTSLAKMAPNKKHPFCKFEYSEGVLCLSLTSADAPEISIEIAAEGSEDLIFGFNGRYLKEYLATAPETVITLTSDGDGRSPFRIDGEQMRTIEHETSRNYEVTTSTFVQMPMKLK